MCECEKYFVIYKGDDTDFIEGQSLVVEISTDIDLDGSTATFSFLGFSQTFDPIPSDKKLNIIIPHSETAKFPVGMIDATVTITNRSSKIRTVSNTIPIKVTQSVDEAYSPDNPNAISVTLSNGETGRLNAALDDIELLKKNKADKTDLEGFATIEDLLAFYYPDGNVTSMSQITTNGIEYAVGEDGGAYVVKGEGLTGHVVLPWKVTIGGNEYKVTAIGISALSRDLYPSNSFTEFTAPITVKIVGNSSFTSNVSLTTVNLPSATSIENYAFAYCSSLASINLPSAKSIGGNTFVGCDFIKSVSLPSATTINSGAFDSCLSLESVSIPSATSIGTYAFNGCGSLKTIDFGPSPKSAVPSLGSFAFEGVPTSCKFIIPIGMYDEWISASMWSNLYAQGYKFEGYASTAQLANKADKATTLAGYGITDAATMASLAPEYSPSSAYAVGAFVYHDGNIYQCKTSVPEGGEAWNAEHWELRKLDDFFTESNSLLNGRLVYERNATGLKDRAFNALTFDGTEYNLSTALASVTPTASGQPRDLLIVATATAATTISFTAGTIKGDKPTIDGVGKWLITLTEFESGVWYCRQIKMEDAA